MSANLRPIGRAASGAGPPPAVGIALPRSGVFAPVTRRSGAHQIDAMTETTSKPRDHLALRIARWSARHPWRAIAGWLVFVTFAVVLGGGTGMRELSPSESGAGESMRADRAVESGEFPTVVSEQVLVQARNGTLDPGTAAEVLTGLESAYATVPEVVALGEPIPSTDGTSLLVPLELDSGGLTGEDATAHALEQLEPVLAATADVQARYPDLWVEQAGEASIGAAIDEVVAEDFRRAEVLSLPVTLVVLIVAFGALIAVGVPVVLAATAVAGAIGLSALVSQLVPVTAELASVVLLIGMAVGVDYSLFYIRRAREARAAGAATLDAVELAAATSGRAVVVSGIAVVIAMSGMLLSGSAIFVSFAVGTMIVVTVAVLGSVTVLPAILAKLGRWVDRPRVPLLHRLKRHEGGGFWPWAMRVVLSRPAVSLAIGTATLLALAAPALSMQLKMSGIDSLPADLAPVQTYERIVAAYPTEGTSHTVVVWDEDPLIPQAIASLGAVAADSSSADASTVEVSPDGTVARVELGVPYEYGSEGADASLAELREHLPEAMQDVAVEYGVTGDTASNHDFTAVMSERLPLVVGFVLLMSFVVLTLAFRSVVVAATAIALNLLSVAAAYGVVVLVFQHTWAEGLLGFVSSGGVVSWLPLFLFVVLFGLSMDYHVFLVSRIREAVDRGLPTSQAVAAGVQASAGVITSAAAVMVGVFSIFAVLSLLEFKQLGVGLAAAVLIDATLVRVVLLPSAMVLLGRWNWWLPGQARRERPVVRHGVEDPPRTDLDELEPPKLQPSPA